PQLPQQLALAERPKQFLFSAQVLPDLDLPLVHQEGLALGVVAFLEDDVTRLEGAARNLPTRTAHALPSWYRMNISTPMIRRFVFPLVLSLLIGAALVVHPHAPQTLTLQVTTPRPH